MPKAFKMFI